MSDEQLAKPIPAERDCYVEQLGGSYIVRYARDGSVLCFRPDQQSADEYAAKFREIRTYGK